MPECSCRGANPNCYRCSGRGVTGKLSEQRNVSVSDVKRELKAITNRPGRRRELKNRRRNIVASVESAVPKQHRYLTPAIPRKVEAVCPNCGVKVSQIRLQGHMKERCPMLKAKRPVTPGVQGPRPKAVAKPNPKVIIVSGDEKQQAFFERSLIQGGLFRKR